MESCQIYGVTERDDKPRPASLVEHLQWSTASTIGVYEHTKAAISPAYLVFTVHHHFSQSTLLSSIPSCLPRIATNSSVILGGPQT